MLKLTTFFLFFGFLTNIHANTLINTIVNDKYENVRDNLVDAIEQKSIKISKIFQASAMLDRTQSEVFSMSGMYSRMQSGLNKMLTMPNLGQTNKRPKPKRVYEKAEIIEFCSADISHELILANPLNIAICPFKIAIFSLADSPHQTHLVYYKFVPMDKDSKAVIDKANHLIETLVENASW